VIRRIACQLRVPPALLHHRDGRSPPRTTLAALRQQLLRQGGTVSVATKPQRYPVHRAPARHGDRAPITPARSPTRDVLTVLVRNGYACTDAQRDCMHLVDTTLFTADQRRRAALPGAKHAWLKEQEG
jgi:hypothetical protein